MNQQPNKSKELISRESLIMLGTYAVPKEFRKRISKEIQYGSIAPGRLAEFIAKGIN